LIFHNCRPVKYRKFVTTNAVKQFKKSIPRLLTDWFGNSSLAKTISPPRLTRQRLFYF